MAVLRNNKIWEKIDKGVFIIAEIGKNFIQSIEEKSVAEYLENAKKLVDAAVDSGVDAVKFQTHNFEDEQLKIEIISPHFKGSERYNWVRRNTLATPLESFWLPLKKYCEEKGIIFFSTPMSRGAAQILDQVGVDLWKVGSGDILDFVMLDYLRNSGKPVIFSSGMSTLSETEMAINFLKEKNTSAVLLHCVSKYPCPPEEMNLGTISFYNKRFNLPIGFSDHSLSLDTSVFAVALGAKVIEKHFSFSRDLWGADHKVSMTPREMKELVARIRILENDSVAREKLANFPEISKYIGMADKIMLSGEEVFRPIFRKSLMAGCDMEVGEILTPEKIYAMRPQMYADGLPSEKYPEVLGKKLKAKIKKYDPINFDILG